MQCLYQVKQLILQSLLGLELEPLFKMRKILLFLILFNLLVINAKAEIAYIDINFILNKSEVGIFLNNYVENIKKKELYKYNKIEDELIKKEKLLIEQQNILDKEEFQKRLKNLTNNIQKYKSDKNLSVDELNKLRIDKTKEILKVLNPIITQYVDSNSISIVLPKKNIIIGKKNLDITNQIIKILNKNIKTLNF